MNGADTVIAYTIMGLTILTIGYAIYHFSEGRKIMGAIVVGIGILFHVVVYLLIAPR